jgi:murein DD-endopeptidase MepM/ murein hydrolase activator NlpD
MFRRTTIVVFVIMSVIVFVIMSVCSARPASALVDAGPWQHPVPGVLVRHFEPPACRFCAGHLGVDYRAAPGTIVGAAGAGTVSFAGSVGGTLHVVVLHAHPHAHALRTSYSFLESVSVRRGQRVRIGQTVGTAGGTGRNHGGDVVHFGLRLGDEYLDPMLLFRPPDLTRAVHLAPFESTRTLPAAGGERAALRRFAVGGRRAAIATLLPGPSLLLRRF